jgi:hypothetical protein
MTVNQFDADRKDFLTLIQTWHAGHSRQDQVTHCENVMRLPEQALALESVPDGTRRDMLLAALGHDLYEDSKIPHKDIANDFGSEVDRLIQVVTGGEDDVPAYVDQVASGPEEARLIKLADGIDNYGGLVEYGLLKGDPAKWVEKVRRHMEPMFSRLETIPFRQYPNAGALLSKELAKRREGFWAVVEDLLRDLPPSRT